MSDRTQDLKNLRAVATRCKNYTDAEIAKSEEKMKWYMGEYSVSTSDDNTSASTKTVPANATRCKIKRIYGLTQKLNPTTASDSTSYSVKTMPATVYDFDISKVEGNSEKSENLIVVEDGNINAQGMTFAFLNGVCNSSGTPSSTGWITIKRIVLQAGTYYFKDFSTASNKMRIIDSNYNAKTTQPFTLNAETTMFLAITGQSITDNGQLINSMPMLVSGSSEPTTYKQGYTGIHNFKWNGVVVKNSDDEVMQNISIDLSSITYNGSQLFEENSLKAVGTAKDYITPYKAHKGVGGIKINDLEILYNETYQVFYTYINGKANGYINVYMNGFDTVAEYYQTMTNLQISGTENTNGVNFKDTSCANITEFKTKYGNDYVYYELATPIEVSINWASLLRGITGYSNGTISLLNTNNQDTANLITYNSIIKENCCAKMVQSRGGNVIKTVTFPTQASDGYSAVSVANVRDFTTNKRETNVSKNTFTNNEETYTRSVSSAVDGYQVVVSNSNWKNGTSNAIENFDITVGDSYSSEHYSLATNRFNISFNKSRGIDTVEKAKQYIGGRIFYYELADASKTSTDITPIENVIEVQPGDELAFYDANDNLVTIQSDLTYRIEVAR